MYFVYIFSFFVLNLCKMLVVADRGSGSVKLTNSAGPCRGGVLGDRGGVWRGALPSSIPFFILQRVDSIFLHRRKTHFWCHTFVILMNTSLGYSGPMLAQKLCRISLPHFVAECHMRWLNQASFVLQYFALLAFSGLCVVFVVCLFFICILFCI